MKLSKTMEYVYKLRLKGTDLFYQPTRGSYRHTKSNLSERGKIYDREPKPKEYRGFQNITKASSAKHGIGKLQTVSWRRNEYGLDVSEEDWEVVKYKIVEED